MELVVRLPLRGGGERRALLVQGPGGWGECSPLAGYPCPPERARAAADEAAAGGWPPAVRAEVVVNALVPAVAPAEAAGRAAEAVAAGFTCIKVKVGSGDDAGRVAAVRDAAGPAVALRVDANGVWTLDEAVDRIRDLARYDLELVEQPVESMDDLARVRRVTAVPVAADECVRDATGARRLAELEAADVVVLKVQPLGGVRAAMAVAEAAGMPAVVTSMLETSVGLAAGLALAAALPDLPYACGLATAGFLAADVVADPLVPVDGRLAVRRPEPDPALLALYGVPA